MFPFCFTSVSIPLCAQSTRQQASCSVQNKLTLLYRQTVIRTRGSGNGIIRRKKFTGLAEGCCFCQLAIGLESALIFLMSLFDYMQRLWRKFRSFQCKARMCFCKVPQNIMFKMVKSCRLMTAMILTSTASDDKLQTTACLTKHRLSWFQCAEYIVPSTSVTFSLLFIQLNFVLKIMDKENARCRISTCKVRLWYWFNSIKLHILWPR
jgi:hypothetical protein